MSEPTVKNTCIYFVKRFASFYFQTYTSYIQQFNCGGETFKKDTKAAATAGVVGALCGLGTALGSGTQFLNDKTTRKKIHNLTEFDFSSPEEKAKFEKILIEAGTDLFYSFEFQFMRVTPAHFTGKNERLAFDKLAEEGTYRSINYFVKNPNAEFNCLNILRGILSGESGDISLTNLARHKIKVIDYKGHSLKFRGANGTVKDIKTEEFYTQPTEACVQCYQTKTSDCCDDSYKCVAKYYRPIWYKNDEQHFLGYRRRFRCESNSPIHFPFEKEQNYRYEINQSDFVEIQDCVLKSVIENNPARHAVLLLKEIIIAQESVSQKLEEMKMKPEKSCINVRWWPAPLELTESYIERRDPNGEHENLVDALRSRLLNHGGRTAIVSKSATVSGVPGVGKTTTARAYAIRFAAEYDLIVNLEAERDKLKESLLDFATFLKIQVRETSTQIGNIATAIYTSDSLMDKKVLIIFDNAENYQTISQCLPQSKEFHVLITSTSQQWGQLHGYGRIDKISLEVFSDLEVEEFFFVVRDKYSKIDPKTCTLLNDAGERKRLAERLGKLPLALSYAVAAIYENGITVEEYIGELDKCDTSRLVNQAALEPLDDYGRSTFQAMVVSTNLIESATNISDNIRRVALRILNMCAYFDPDSIGKTTFLSLGTVINNMDGNIQTIVETAIQLLAKYSLVSLNTCIDFMTPKGDDWYSFNIHRLLQTVLRLRHKSPKMYSVENWKSILNDAFQTGVSDWYEGRLQDDYEGKKRHAITLWQHVRSFLSNSNFASVFDACAHFPALIAVHTARNKVDDEYFERETQNLYGRFNEDDDLPLVQLRNAQARHKHIQHDIEDCRNIMKELLRIKTDDPIIRQQLLVNNNLSLCDVNREQTPSAEHLKNWESIFQQSIRYWSPIYHQNGHECDFDNFILIHKAYSDLPVYVNLIPVSNKIPLNPMELAQHIICMSLYYYFEENEENSSKSVGLSTAKRMIQQWEQFWKNMTDHRQYREHMKISHKLALEICKYRLQCIFEDEKSAKPFMETVYNQMTRYVEKCKTFWERNLPYSWNEQLKFHNGSIARFRRWVEEPLALYCKVVFQSCKFKEETEKWKRLEKLLNFLLDGCTTIWSEVAAVMISNNDFYRQTAKANFDDELRYREKLFDTYSKLHVEERFKNRFPRHNSLVCFCMMGLEFVESAIKINPTRVEPVLTKMAQVLSNERCMSFYEKNETTGNLDPAWEYVKEIQKILLAHDKISLALDYIEKLVPAMETLRTVYFESFKISENGFEQMEKIWKRQIVVTKLSHGEAAFNFLNFTVRAKKIAEALTLLPFFLENHFKDFCVHCKNQAWPKLMDTLDVFCFLLVKENLHEDNFEMVFNLCNNAFEQDWVKKFIPGKQTGILFPFTLKYVGDNEILWAQVKEQIEMWSCLPN